MFGLCGQALSRSLGIMGVGKTPISKPAMEPWTSQTLSVRAEPYRGG